MSECLNCGGRAEYQFHVLEVQTLHIRDFGGEKRVQALGLFQDYAVCAGCARARLEAVRAPGKSMKKSCVLFGALLALGAALAAAFWRADGVLRLLGLAAAACGILGLCSAVHTGKQKRAEFAALSEEEALSRAAWECLTAHAPKKAGDNDLTYIPADASSLALDKDGLMRRYDLLPAIAGKAYGLLREETK